MAHKTNADLLLRDRFYTAGRFQFPVLYRQEAALTMKRIFVVGRVYPWRWTQRRRFGRLGQHCSHTRILPSGRKGTRRSFKQIARNMYIKNPLLTVYHPF